MDILHPHRTQYPPSPAGLLPPARTHTRVRALSLQQVDTPIPTKLC